MMRSLVFMFLLLFALVGPACWAGAEVVTVEGGYGPFVVQSVAVEQRLKSTAMTDTRSRIVLAPVASVKLQALAEEDSLPRRIGFSRTVDVLSTSVKAGQQLEWHKLMDNGHYAAIEISSPQARALRVAMTVESLPESAEVRFFRIRKDETVDIQFVAATEIVETLRINREADPTDPDGKLFWSPTIVGDTVGIEIYLPAETNPSLVQVAFPLVSHITLLPFSAAGVDYTFQNYGDSAPCQNDVTCDTAWNNLSASVAVVEFSTSEFSYLCTGSLLNDRDPATWKPYFITANHCISTQAEASSVQTHWFWQSASCNGSNLSSLYKKVSGGASLLHTQGMSSSVAPDSRMDATLLRLNSAPPAGAFFAGWTTAVPPESGSYRTSIHHPAADWKKISYGVPDGTAACESSGDTFSCTLGDGNFYVVQWKNGGTETGSSGAALYYNTDFIVGMLSGGNGSCEGAFSVYSSFRAAYYAGNYDRWLNALSGAVAPVNLLLLRR